MNWHNVLEVLKIVGSVIGTFSALANLLPPASTYADYPRFQRFYETFIVKTFAAMSLSFRAQYPSLGLPFFGLRQPPAPQSATTPNPLEMRKS